MIGSDNIIISSLSSSSSGNILTWNAQDRLVDSGILSSNLANTTTVAAVSAGLDARITALPNGLTYNMLSQMDPLNGEINIVNATVLTSNAFGKMHSIAASTPFNVTLPNAVGNVNKVIGIRIDETATAAMFTINCSGSQTIDASGSRMLWAGESAILKSNGTNWNKIAGKTIPMTAKIDLNSDVSNFSSTILTQAALNGVSYASLPGNYDLTNYRLITLRGGVYNITTSIRLTRVSSSFTDPQFRVYKNGTSSGANIMMFCENRNGASWITYNYSFGSSILTNNNDYLELYTVVQTANANIVTGLDITGIADPKITYMTMTEIPNW
jgi:hypothetical protein